MLRQADAGLEMGHGWPPDFSGGGEDGRVRTPVYSNGPDVAWLRLDRRVGRLPNRAWDNGPDILTRQLNKDGAVIVYFDGIRRTYLPEPDELATYVDLVVIDEFEDGVVLARARS